MRQRGSGVNFAMGCLIKKNGTKRCALLEKEVRYIGDGHSWWHSCCMPGRNNSLLRVEHCVALDTHSAFYPVKTHHFKTNLNVISRICKFVWKFKFKLHAPEVTSLKHNIWLKNHLNELKQKTKSLKDYVAIFRSPVGWILFKI